MLERHVHSLILQHLQAVDKSSTSSSTRKAKSTKQAQASAWACNRATEFYLDSKII